MCLANNRNFWNFSASLVFVGENDLYRLIILVVLTPMTSFEVHSSLIVDSCSNVNLIPWYFAIFSISMLNPGKVKSTLLMLFFISDSCMHNISIFSSVINCLTWLFLNWRPRHKFIVPILTGMMGWLIFDGFTLFCFFPALVLKQLTKKSRVQTQAIHKIFCRPQSAFFPIIKAKPQFLIKGISSLKPLILILFVTYCTLLFL